jgi:Tfp pilus assembly protein PilF
MFRKSRVSILLAACLSASVAFVSPTAAWAQAPPEYANPSEHQLTLNDDAVRAIIKGDYAGAVALLEEARSLGELNVTYLNLGRAYQKLEQCQKARDAFERALEAPPVKQPPPAFIKKKVAEYSAELDEECPEVETVEAKETEKTGPQSTDKVEAPPVVEEDSSNVVAWTVTLGGVAMMAGGGAMFALASSERDKVRSQPEPEEGVVTERTMKEAAEIESRANTYDTIGVAALAGGAVITGVGAYLFVADDESSGSQTSVHLDADAVRVQWRVSF